PSACACARPAALRRRSSSGLPGSASACRIRISRTSAPPGNTRALLARDHAAPLAWCSRPRSWAALPAGTLGAIRRGELAARLADVLRGRTDDPVVRVLLEHVCRPARNPAGGEQRREQVGRDAEVAVDRGRPEVDVRVQALLLKDRLLGSQRDLVPVRFPGI